MDRTASNATNKVGKTALVSAIMYEQFEIAKQLIWLGADVGAENSLGQTALQFAVSNVSDKMKMRPKFDVYTEDKLVQTFDLAVCARDEEVLEAVNARRKYKVYDSAARLSLVKELLQAGADINHRDQNGCSPIQCAVYAADLELLKTLLDAGADLHNRNRVSATALHIAILCCDEAMVRLLLSRGASVEVKTMEDYTPLHWAAMFNTKSSHAAIIEELLKYPAADVNCEDGEGRTPFHYILRQADLNMVRHFIELGADISKVDRKYRDTAFHHAVYNEDVRVLNLILETAETAGIPIDQKYNLFDERALNSASARFQVNHVRSLIARGGDVNAIMSRVYSSTPLQSCITGKSEKEEIEENKRIRQTINLLLESGADVNQTLADVPDSMTVLKLAFIRKAIEASNAMIEHVAKIEVGTNKPALNDYNRALINENPNYPEFKAHYDKCRVELEAMKSCKIKDTTIAYFDVLTEPLEVVARYARNRKVLKEFETKTTAYPIYGPQLREKMDAAIVQQKQLETVSNILSKTLRFSDPSNVCFEIIFKYLTKANVEFLITSALEDNATLSITKAL